MKYSVQKHADACNQFTESYVQDICDKLKFVTENARNDELRDLTSDLACADIVIKLARKNNINEDQLLRYLKTYTSLQSIED